MPKKTKTTNWVKNCIIDNSKIFFLTNNKYSKLILLKTSAIIRIVAAKKVVVSNKFKVI